jgi:tetratricopeptide (TPR) repeat protein
MNSLKTLLLLVALALSQWALASDDMIKPIQDEWATIKYRQTEKLQAASYKVLAQKAHRLVEANPNSAQALIWEGIVLSSEAGASGGIGALALAKEARRLLEESIKLDEKALQGSAYTSLGALYAKVPRWPIGFGDKRKAEELLRKGLSINPQGIDPNFFYGEFLIDEGRGPEARSYLEAALRAPGRPGREVADQGRRQEVQALLAKIKD